MMTTTRQTRRKRSVPQRTCVGCRTTVEKWNSIRIVRSADGVQIDPSGKADGRGAYLHNQRSCWEKGLRGQVARALRTELSPEAMQEIRAFLEQLSDEPAV